MSYPPQVYESNNWLISIFLKIRWRYLQVKVHHQQCCGSGCLSRIPEPDFYPSRIPDLGSRITDQKNSNKREGWKKIWCHYFLCSQKFHKIANYFSFEVLKKKIWANFQRIIKLFPQNIVNKLSKIWVWDPGSGKNLFRIPESKKHRILDPDPQHWPPVSTTSLKTGEFTH
jgi:hypothetical protein